MHVGNSLLFSGWFKQGCGLPQSFSASWFQSKTRPIQSTFGQPRPIPQKDMSQEIEFRGYFLLKGQPFFCLFNKSLSTESG